MDQCKMDSLQTDISHLSAPETMLRIHSVESFGSVDGPGIRFVIFLKRYRSYWGEKGGITVSGGEALLQIRSLTELFRKAKVLGINTCLDTSAQPFSRETTNFSAFEVLMNYTDLILLDIKHIDSNAHKQLTGWKNENILDCARYLSDIKKPVWIRHVLVPGINDDDDSLHKLRKFLDSLGNIERVEVLPYHDLGVYKWEQLSLPYALSEVKPPTEENLLHARKILTE